MADLSVENQILFTMENRIDWFCYLTKEPMLQELQRDLASIGAAKVLISEDFKFRLVGSRAQIKTATSLIKTRLEKLWRQNKQVSSRVNLQVLKIRAWKELTVMESLAKTNPHVLIAISFDKSEEATKCLGSNPIA